jgi:hypothetical protein
VIGAVLIGAGLLEGVFELHAQNHPWRVGILGGVALLLTGLVLLVFPSRTLKITAVLLFGSWGIGYIAGLDARDHELGYYCRYGAASQAELDACMKRINTDEIDELDTPAARFARGETHECGRGSGPFCAEAARDSANE